MNAWSMLYDELNMDDQQFGYTVTGEKWIKETGGYEWTPEISSSYFVKTVTPPEQKQQKQQFFKFNEEAILKEMRDYIFETYRAHYASGKGIQTLDLIESCGDAAAFCRSNILKYATRYDKKGCAKMDIKKIIHYAVLLYHFTNQDQETDARGYETF